eukprot:TRINITY_DN2442_c0_g1_i1.p1 TRINITY_DN2442_c0_g1~~TRINITY_DN2442_c0_g1_i1.p1  ORF type:complete len:198 (-),score=34.24 TRINITY_DN2442_c0_g1_i1:52-645(-)
MRVSTCSRISLLLFLVLICDVESSFGRVFCLNCNDTCSESCQKECHSVQVEFSCDFDEVEQVAKVSCECPSHYFPKRDVVIIGSCLGLIAVFVGGFCILARLKANRDKPRRIRRLLERRLPVDEESAHRGSIYFVTPTHHAAPSSEALNINNKEGEEIRVGGLGTTSPEKGKEKAPLLPRTPNDSGTNRLKNYTILS